MDKFLSENLLSNLGLENLPEDKQEEVLLAIGDNLYKTIVSRAIDELDDKALKEFEGLAPEEKEAIDDVFLFFRAKIKNFDQIMEEEVSRFKEERINFLKALYEEELGISDKEG